MSAEPVGQLLRLASSCTALSNVGYMAVVDDEILRVSMISCSGLR